MTEKLIQCQECLSQNLDNSVYCCQCGSPMRKGIPSRLRKKHWVAVVVIALILTFIMTSAIQFVFYLTADHSSREKQQQVSERIAAPQPKVKSEPAPQPKQSERPSVTSRAVPEKKQAESIEGLTVGSVSIVNPEGRVVAEFSAPVVSGSWLALPTRACVGGNKWHFSVGNNEPIPIEGGLWGRGDAVGFWQLAGDRKFPGPEFNTWQQGKPVRLLATGTGALSEPMTLNPSGVKGTFLYSSLSDPLEAGVFLQGGKVVGWSFGDLLPGAYMWTLGHDADLVYENYVDDFYNETFAGGREEYFSIALSQGSSSSPQRQLQMFAEGFWVRPKLSPQDTPRYLAPETVYPYISKLVEYIMNQGAYQYIATLAEEPLLREIKDPELFMDVVQATQRSYGYESALNFMEGGGADLRREMEGESAELRQQHLDLYIGWIKNLLDAGDTVRGWQIHNRAKSRFSDSPELHLLGVELALATGDWSEAETLLYERRYPPELRETWMLLADRISDMKGQENKIVIRFQPGSSEIPVNAKINDTFDHNFLVDTGATFVTIPFSTVESLGLEEEMSRHQQEVQTAGGPVKANAVTLSSIELQGWVVPNVEALVMDLPNRPGLGLLGLNFLNSFRMNLNADEGFLTLEPK